MFDLAEIFSEIAIFYFDINLDDIDKDKTFKFIN